MNSTLKFPQGVPLIYLSILICLSYVFHDTFPDEAMSRNVSACFMRFGVAFGNFSAYMATKRKKAVVH